MMHLCAVTTLGNKLCWQNAFDAAEDLYMRRHKELQAAGMWGVPTGGWFAVLLVGHYCLVEGIPPPAIVGNWTYDGVWPVVLDDLVDSGRTLQPYADHGIVVDALFRKPGQPGRELTPDAHILPSGWITLPWEDEKKQGPEDNVVRLLEWLGEDPNREGLRETPGRVCRALKEMTAGREQDPEAILSKQFGEYNDQMVVLNGIRFTSICEHHLLPFTGTASVGYLPKWKDAVGAEFLKHNGTYQVVGVSKLARLVECYARRLQNQERLANQVAQALTDVLKPKGVGVVLRASHGCMACRGVNQPGAEMVTSALRGVILEDSRARAEFLALASGRP